MNTLICFMKKEWTEYVRTKKVMLVLGIAILFGIMNPAITKLTPWMLENFSASGMEIVIDESMVDAVMSWQQFYKNTPMMLVAFILIFCGTFTNEYQKNTLVLVVTKGLARWKVVIGKACPMIVLWSIGFFVQFGLTYYYNDYYWDNSVMDHLWFAAFCYWLFSVLMILLLVLFSCISSNTGGVILGVGAVYFTLMMASMFEKIEQYLPNHLCSAELTSGGDVSDMTKAIVVASVSIVCCMVGSIMTFNKRQL